MFRVTARTILELGSELISTDIIAFYELIKNAFDARSKTGVEIAFNVVLRRNEYLQARSEIDDAIADNTRSKSGRRNSMLAELKTRVISKLDSSARLESITRFRELLDDASTLEMLLDRLYAANAQSNWIEISDTGSGMSLNELNDNFLTIGTPSRKREVDLALRLGSKSSPYLGEKGIGRLAAMRLGGGLAVQSARQEDLNINLLDVDWRLFNDIDAMVEDIPVETKRGPKKPAKDYSGTKLTVVDLSEDWTERRIRDMASYEFARLTDPFVDPKKRPRIALVWNGARINIPWMSGDLISNAHATFKGEYKIIDGEPILSVRMEAINLGYDHPREVDTVTLTLPDLEGLLTGPHQELPFSALTSVGPFEFEALRRSETRERSESFRRNGPAFFCSETGFVCSHMAKMMTTGSA